MDRVLKRSSRNNKSKQKETNSSNEELFNKRKQPLRDFEFDVNGSNPDARSKHKSVINNRWRRKITPIAFDIEQPISNDVQKSSFKGISNDYVDYGDLTYVCSACGAKLWLKETKRGKLTQQQTGAELLCCQKANNRKEAIRGKNKTIATSSGYLLDGDLIVQIMQVLDEHNPLVKTFWMARERFKDDPNMKLKIKLIGRRTKDGRNYNLPTVDKVAALIVGDINVSSFDERDILLPPSQIDCLLFYFGTSQINCPDSFLANQKRFGTEGVIDSHVEGLKRISELHPEYLALQYPLLFIYAEDGYRTDVLHRYVDVYLGTTRKKKRVTMREFFAYKHQERDVPTLVHLGQVYTVEFQKRGLPHAHICLFLDERSKMPQPEDVDKYICAEIPDEINEPKLYQLVSDLMIHDPCGDKNPSCQCTDTETKKCTKRFPKPFSDVTKTDEDGYPIYRRRNNGRTVRKQGHDLDNSCVVAYKPKLLKMYQAHLNVEWYNQIGLIRYLFKYINKGNDKITTHLCDQETDEIKQYYDCRYVSSCEAMWRIFSFDIHHHHPSVIRLPFHLEGEHQIIFDKDEVIEQVLEKPSVNTSMFLEWMKCNGCSQQARELTYVDFPTKFIWNKDDRVWKLRKRKTGAIGRIHHVSPAAGDLFYLRILLNKVKGPTSYEEIGRGVFENHLIIDELSYDKSTLEVEHADFITKLTTEQKDAYDQIIKAVYEATGAVFFLYGFGATSGIAALLLSGGRTAHSHFRIPLQLTDESFCTIKSDSNLAELIRRAKLIIWDEAPMVNKMCVEALDRSFRDICRQINHNSMDTIFGGKIVVFVNMRLGGIGASATDSETRMFAEWILEIGNGNIGESEDGVFDIELPQDLLIIDSVDPIGSMISTIYPEYLLNLANPQYYQQRAILAPTHEVVDIIMIE
ncbi:uncharacterized protein [Rutidosis leptorrhynchoides]|uniref:uncharacterized protein n=1 Tax=Rutidosis leptorrhynchoides TaxID=125765 RepID=UPI003A9A0F4C